MKRLSLLAVAASLITVGATASAESLRPASAHSLDLGPVAGVAYYTVSQGGFHVMATVSPTHTTKPIRVSAALLPGQSLALSLPLDRDGHATAVHIVRVENDVHVHHGSPFASVTAE